MPEGAGVELGAGSFDFFGWDVAAFDGRVAPALPQVRFVVLRVAPEVVEPARGALRGGDEQRPPLLVSQSGPRKVVGWQPAWRRPLWLSVAWYC